MASDCEDHDNPNANQYDEESNVSDDDVFEQNEEFINQRNTESNKRSAQDIGLNKKYKNKLARKTDIISIEIGNMIVCASSFCLY